jgi:flavodoxin
MKSLVAYDSVFGNTEKIAQAIGNALGSLPEVEIRRVGDVQPGQLAGLELLVVGSPTRGFRPTPAITKLLKGIPRNGLQGIRVAAFDTRVSMDDVNSSFLRTMVNWLGYAAEKIAGRLKQKGGVEATLPGAFIVQGPEGPLAEGELERAAEWASLLACPS